MAIENYLSKLMLPDPDSHKGQNGKVLLIGGSDLFHAASKWSLDIASKFVDMVFYSSVPMNNELIREAKGEFWNGIVIAREQIEDYLEEADVILIGPGMTRTDDTGQLVNQLLQKYPDKKWVIDAGALQMLDVSLLQSHMILTPHRTEFDRLRGRQIDDDELVAEVKAFSQSHHNVCVIVKGQVDLVVQGRTMEQIKGGNAGMTKGGTGDVLAGLVAALYCHYLTFSAAVIASYVNKRAGDSLWNKVGPYFNASDLVEEIPQVMWDLQQWVEQSRSSD